MILFAGFFLKTCILDFHFFCFVLFVSFFLFLWFSHEVEDHEYSKIICIAFSSKMFSLSKLWKRWNRRAYGFLDPWHRGPFVSRPSLTLGSDLRFLSSSLEHFYWAIGLRLAYSFYYFCLTRHTSLLCKLPVHL